jgi:regulator of RNase E activity RraA
MSASDRLQQIPSSILYDVIRGMGAGPRVLHRDIRAIEPSMRCAGPVFTIRGCPDPSLTPDESLLAWVECLSAIPPGAVAVCQPQDDTRALMGELSAECLRIKGVKGYIVDGGCRDAEGVVAQGFPVFCRFFTPIDIVGAWRFEALGEPIVIRDVPVRPDDHVVADRDGIVLVPSTNMDDILAAAEAKMSDESAMARAIRDGMDPKQAYLKYRVF